MGWGGGGGLNQWCYAMFKFVAAVAQVKGSSTSYELPCKNKMPKLLIKIRA